jgi:HD-GYP domain-containing protein (c-di-GMP phosphodiesterase class II)
MARLADAELIAKARRRRERRPGRRERWTAITVAAAFLAVALPLADLHSARHVSPLEAAVLTLAFAFASLIEFEVGTGMAVPTQIVFVPMLFLLPTGSVPIAVAAGYLLGEAIRVAHTRTAFTRPTMLLGSSWFAVGPCLVLLLAGGGPPAWSRLPVYVIAFAAQFASDTAATVARDAVLGVRPNLSFRALGWAYAVDAMLSPVGIVFALVALDRPVAVLAILPLLGVLARFARDRRAHIDALLDLSRTYRGTALVLGDVIEADDSYTGLHSRNVVALAMAIADELGLDEIARRDVEFTALLHDVGKLRIPKELINKPGPLTPEERTLIETHTVEGERMLSGIGGYLSQVGASVRACHERFDGTGYPDGLAGAEIPIAARIVFCCDAFDAMTSDRPYRDARPVAEALAEMRRCAGTQFDPAAVAALETVLAEDLDAMPERRAA